MGERTEDDEWFDRVEKLRERLVGNDPDERIRQIARQEADKRIAAVVMPILGVVGAWWVGKEYGQPASYLLITCLVGYFIWTVVRMDRDPQHERHLIALNAEDLNRLTLVAEAHEAGEQVWFVQEKKYERDIRRVHVFDNDRWNGFWKSVHGYMLAMQGESPKRRRKRLMDAARRARVALEQGESLAKGEDAELVFWARDYLHKLKQA